MNKYTVGVVLSIGVLLSPVFAQAAGLTTAQVNAVIQLLQSFNADKATIATVQAALGTGGPITTDGWCHTFNTNLKIGSNGEEVGTLRTALVREGFRGASSEGEVQIFVSFDETLASFVTGFQEKYTNEILTPNGLLHGTGYVGVSTRAKLNSLYGCNIPQPNANAPVISGVSGPTSLQVDQQGTWTVKASDSSNSSSLSYGVIWGDEVLTSQIPGTNMPFSFPIGQQTTFTHAYSQAGNYAPMFTVTNNANQSVRASISVNVGGVTNLPTISSLSPASGTVGTNIAVYGANFDRSSLVYFNGHALSTSLNGDSPNSNSSPSTNFLVSYLSFIVPTTLLGSCPPAGMGIRCSDDTPVTPGTYSVQVVNLGVKSNSLSFTVTTPTTAVCSGTEHACPCATGRGYYCLFQGAMCINPTSACPAVQ